MSATHASPSCFEQGTVAGAFPLASSLLPLLLHATDRSAMTAAVRGNFIAPTYSIAGIGASRQTDQKMARKASSTIYRSNPWREGSSIREAPQVLLETAQDEPSFAENNGLPR